MRRITALMGFALLSVLVLGVWSPVVSAELNPKVEALARLSSSYPGVQAYQEGALITRLYGHTFGYGMSAEGTAETFRREHAWIFGVPPEDLNPQSNLVDGRHVQPVMYDQQTGQYKFTLVYYSQHSDGVPVFRSDLRLLVKNEPDYPLVLAASALRDLGGFRVPAGVTANRTMAEGAARTFESSLMNFSDPRLVVWAGVNDEVVSPSLAMEVIADNGAKGTEDYQKWLLLVDAQTGEVLYTENMVLNVDVTGNVKAMATQGKGPDICENEAQEAMKYARVYIQNGNTAYADSLGNYTITNSGSSPVTVLSYVRGRWFQVWNDAGAESFLSLSVTPPGPANFVHNSANTAENYRAEVNAYVESNVVRDFTLKYNPAYPGLQQNDFPVHVNLASTCNAYYDYTSTNFYHSGGGCPNTAYCTVVHHEYGHHLVSMAGSGQGQYGEGMGDVMGTLITDDAGIGYGFFSNCAVPLRTADNTKQYPCSDEIHECGRLISGCVWDTRDALILTHPNDYMDILANLAVNAMLLHTGDMIAPDITIDYLTLDDDNGNIYDGTPHYNEICAGFNVHNMDCPALQLLGFNYPNGLPQLLNPSGGTTVRVEVYGVTGTPQPGTGKLYYNGGSGWTNINMTQVSPNIYDAVFPAFTCKTTVQFYFTAQTTVGFTVVDPPGAPTTTYSAVAATGTEVVFSDDFSTNQGWTGLGGTGEWTIGAATGGNGNDGYGGPDPAVDHSPTADNKVLGNDLTSGSGGDYAANIGSTYWITSPNINCTGRTGLTLTYWRWLGVEQNIYDHAYLQGYNGTSWVTLFENGSSTIDESSWSKLTHNISSIADNNANFKLRFGIGATDVAWQYCGWNIDDIEILEYLCNPTQSVTINMIPNNPPISVPRGGSFTYTGVLTNNLGSPTTTDVWVMINVPGYGMYGPVMQVNNVPLAANQTISYPNISQYIPTYAPVGSYTYYAYCGAYPIPSDTASFAFTVTALVSGNADNWMQRGWFGDNDLSVPQTTSLIGNFPNPFNPTTTFNYALANDADVSLEVYNLMGQKVAIVVNEHQTAGYKSINWDASQYSSGVYFYKLSVGDQTFTKRMTLLK